MNKTLMTLQERFFCPRLGDIVRSYIVSCHVCQLFKTAKDLTGLSYKESMT